MKLSPGTVTLYVALIMDRVTSVTVPLLQVKVFYIDYGLDISSVTIAFLHVNVKVLYIHLQYLPFLHSYE